MSSIRNDETVAQFAYALFDLAHARKETTATLEAAERLAQVYHDSLDFRRFAAHPRFDPETTKRVLDALDKKLRFGGVLRKTIDLLAKTRNLALFPDVCTLLRTRVAEEQGEIKAHVVSARALSATEKLSIKEALDSRLAAQKSSNEPSQRSSDESAKGSRATPSKRFLSLSFSEDAALLSGVVITMRSRMIDLSLRSDLRRLREALSREEQAA